MDVVISLDFPPSIGGAHLWLYEVYRRWPAQVAVYTRHSPMTVKEAEQIHVFDTSQLGSLKIYREGADKQEINLLNIRYIVETILQAKRIAKLARSGGGISRLHALRAFPEGFIAYLAKRLFLPGAILVTYAHGEEILVAATSGQLSAIMRWVYKDSNVIITNSNNTAELVRGVCSSAQVVCIHPGVDQSYFSGDRQEARADVRSRYGWSQDAYVLFSIARMEPRKNHATVIRAVAVLREKGYDIRYICAGDGETRIALELLAGNLDMQGSVIFPGRISDAQKLQYLQGADIHIMVSVQHGAMIEGFGIVFIEAAAVGIPSIAGNSGGQAEAVLDGKTGLVVDGMCQDQVIEAIMTLAVDTKFRYQLSAAAKNWASEHEWDLVVERTLKALSGLGIEIC